MKATLGGISPASQTVLRSPRWVSEKKNTEKRGKNEKGLLLLMDIICFKLRLRNCSQILNRLSSILRQDSRLYGVINSI